MLRPYQQDMEDNLHSAWRSGKRHVLLVLPCGAGKSVLAADIAKRTTDKGGRVLFLVHRRELCEQIEATFTTYGVDMALCTIGMVQTVSRHTERYQAPKLIITDEAHHASAAGYKRVYDAFPKAYRLGVTATPKRTDGGGLNTAYDEMLIGVTTPWLIDNHYLAPYRYFSVPVADFTGIKKSRGEYRQADLDGAMQNVIYGDVVGSYQRLAGGIKAVCYCHSVDAAKRTADAFNDAGIVAQAVDGGTDKAEREAIMRRFRDGQITVLCNCDLISEGFDVPDCGCSILLRKTASLTLFIQQSMRCMRYQPGKEAIIIDHVGNAYEHGLPDDDRAWTLKGRGKDKTESYTLHTCPYCFNVWHAGITCPRCGNVLPKRLQPRKDPKQVKAELEELTREKVKDYEQYTECQSYRELRAFCKRKGYKPGWAFYKAKEMGLMRRE